MVGRHLGAEVRGLSCRLHRGGECFLFLLSNGVYDALSRKVHGDNANGHNEHHQPLFDVESVAAEDDVAEIGKPDLHRGNHPEYFEEALVFENVREEVDLLGARVKGVEDGGEEVPGRCRQRRQGGRRQHLSGCCQSRR